MWSQNLFIVDVGDGRAWVISALEHFCGRFTVRGRHCDKCGPLICCAAVMHRNMDVIHLRKWWQSKQHSKGLEMRRKCSWLICGIPQCRKTASKCTYFPVIMFETRILNIILDYIIMIPCFLLLQFDFCKHSPLCLFLICQYKNIHKSFKYCNLSVETIKPVTLSCTQILFDSRLNTIDVFVLAFVTSLLEQNGNLLNSSEWMLQKHLVCVQRCMQLFCRAVGHFNHTVLHIL